MSVYTKKGDKGKTSVFEPDPAKRKRISKDACQIKAIGALDELNSYIGVARSSDSAHKRNKDLLEVQRNLFTIGSILAGAAIGFKSNNTNKLEKIIDEIEEALPPLRNFLLPMGTVFSTHLMYARALARRAERDVVTFSKEASVNSGVLKYMNRLSDFLFVLFREENHEKGQKEEPWVGRDS